MAELTPTEREAERGMIDNPSRWPLLVLPMKNSSQGVGGWPTLGFLRTGMNWPDKRRVLELGGMSTPTGETVEFQDTDALLDAGWRVD